MDEVKEVRGGGAKALDAASVELPDGSHDRIRAGATRTRLQEATEGPLVLDVLVDVRDSQLRFPEKRVVGAPEDLSLLGDRADDGLE